MAAPTIADYAASYVRQFGIGIVPIPPRLKNPLVESWGHMVITDPEQARRYYTEQPGWNIGAALGPSRLCSLDVDDQDAFRAICEEFGWSLDELVAQHPTVQGRPGRMRIMFRVPDGLELPYHSLTWPDRDNPKRRVTVFEIRAATDGKQRQDVLPPSIHPETGEPYQWLTRPTAASGIPTPPDWLIALWQNWDALKPQLQQVCPWAPPPELPKRARTRSAPVEQGDSVIDAYNASQSVTDALQAYGYRKQGRRWLSPHSGTKLPGVNVFEKDNRCWIHHASDPLCSTDSGQPVAPFDLYCQYEHGGDIRAACKAAADALGMKRQARKPVNIDRETGEILAARSDSPRSDSPHSGLPADAAPVDPATIDTFSPLPDANSNGKPLGTIENLAEICRRLGVIIRYNVIRKEEEILIPSASFSIDNGANASLAWLASWCQRFRMPTGNLSDYVTYMADRNQYNPVAQWVTSKPWDGRSRLRELYCTITAEGEADDMRLLDLKEAMIRRWLISAVAAAFEPVGVAAKGVLVLQGEQNLGKTSWFKRLAPAELGVIQDGLMLRPDDRDSVKQVVSHWLVELGELDATFRKADIAQLKSFLGRDRDTLRRAYARLESHYARRTVFFASVNPRQFLHDGTGNIRYWTISCERIDYRHTIDMQQVWAEVYESLYRKGESWHLSPSEADMLNEQNRDYEVLDPIRERLQTRLAWNADRSLWLWRTATEIMGDIGFDRPTRADVTNCGQIVAELNNRQQRKMQGGKRVSLVPPTLDRWT